MSDQDEDPQIEQMVRWMCHHFNHFTISTFNGGVNIYAAWMGSEVDGAARRLGTGPTLREALRDAIEHERERMSKA